MINHKCHDLCHAATSNVFCVLPSKECLKVQEVSVCEQIRPLLLSNSFYQINKLLKCSRRKVNEITRKTVFYQDNLKKRGLRLANRCVMCGVADELVDHLLHRCDALRNLWTISFHFVVLLQSHFNLYT